MNKQTTAIQELLNWMSEAEYFVETSKYPFDRIKSKATELLTKEQNDLRMAWHDGVKNERTEQGMWDDSEHWFESKYDAQSIEKQQRTTKTS